MVTAETKVYLSHMSEAFLKQAHTALMLNVRSIRPVSPYYENQYVRFEAKFRKLGIVSGEFTIDDKELLLSLIEEQLATH